MPYEIEYTPQYEKKLYKFLKKHASIISRYKKTISLVEVNPFHPSLRLHKLSGKLQEVYSISIDMQYRISIEFYIEDKKVIPINIGTHDEIY